MVSTEGQEICRCYYHTGIDVIIDVYVQMAGSLPLLLFLLKWLLVAFLSTTDFQGFSLYLC